MSSDGIVFRDPPPSQQAKGGSHGSRARLLAPLRERPGDWALIATKASTNAASALALQIRRGQAAGVEPGEFETAARGCEVYARFVGGGEAA